MLKLQSFIEIPALIDNSPDGTVAPVGELSELCKTFSKNKQYFTKSNLQVEMVTFMSKRDDVDIVAPATFTDHILGVSQWIYTQAILGNIKSDSDSFQRLLVGNYQTTISAVVVGGMIAYNGNWYPRWVSWKYEIPAANAENPSDLTNEVIVWFANDDFYNDYLGFEIEVVFPILPVDTFLGVKSVVSKAMESFTIPTHHDKVNTVADGYPYTAITTQVHTWYDLEDATATLEIPITTISYGRAALNPTHQRNAKRDYILANSGSGAVVWAKVFPSIFTTTKFTIVPGWTINGVPNQEDIAALYSPLLPYEFIVSAVSKFGEWQTTPVSGQNNATPVLPTTSVADLPSVYKSLSAVAIAGPENMASKTTLKDIVPDYALIGYSPDISRLSKKTTDWLALYFKALIAAEEYHPYNSTLDVVKLVDPDDEALYYWVFEFDNVEFRVVARKAVWQ